MKMEKLRTCPFIFNHTNIEGGRQILIYYFLRIGREIVLYLALNVFEFLVIFSIL